MEVDHPDYDSKIVIVENFEQIAAGTRPGISLTGTIVLAPPGSLPPGPGLASA